MKRISLLAPLLVACFLPSCLAVDPGAQPSGSGEGYTPPPSPPTREWQPPPQAPPPTREWRQSAPAPLLQVSPALLDFGTIEPGMAADLDLTLSNAGDGGASVRTVSVAGRDLILLADGCSERRLAPGRSCTVRVRFAPESAGTSAGTVLIVTDAPEARRLEVAARGAGVRRRRAVPDIRITPAELDFGAVELGSVKTLDLRVENRGDAELRLRTISIDGGDFDLQNDGCSGVSLRARQTCELRLRFSPNRPGRYSGIVRLRSDDPDDPLLTAPLAGEGRAGREPDIHVRQQQLDFGAIAVGKEQMLEAQILNRGTRQLRIRAMSVDGPGFSVANDGCSGRPLPPRQECTVVVRFAPPSPGPCTGRLGVASDDPDERQVTLPLTGKGREEERQRCPVVRLEPLPAADHPADPLVVTGVLPREGCLTYSLQVQRRGRVAACVPPGYSLTGGGFELAKKKGCRFPDDPVTYRRYLRRDIEAGTVVKDLTLTRTNDARKEFKLIFEFRGAGAQDAATGEDD